MRGLQRMNWALMLLVFGSAHVASAQEGKKIYAQKLLDETLAKHKEVVIMAMHVTPPEKPRTSSLLQTSDTSAKRPTKTICA